MKVYKILKTIQIILIVLALAAFCALAVITISFFSNPLNSLEWDDIEYNGVLYTEHSDWSPIGDQSNEKFAVRLLDYSKRIEDNHTYDAIGYENDPNHVFLYFYGEKYTQENYPFPDVKDGGIAVERIEFKSYGSSNGFSIDNKDLVNAFLVEYRNQSGQEDTMKGTLQAAYRFYIYIKDYSAVKCDGIVALGRSGHLGIMKDDNTIVTLTSSSLEKELSTQMEKIRPT